jgi:hypothetical protein
MRPFLLIRKPVPWAIALPLLSDMMIDTMAPFAVLAIAGMLFRGGTDCAATTPATSKSRRVDLIPPGKAGLMKLSCALSVSCRRSSSDLTRSDKTWPARAPTVPVKSQTSFWAEREPSISPAINIISLRRSQRDSRGTSSFPSSHVLATERVSEMKRPLAQARVPGMRRESNNGSGTTHAGRCRPRPQALSRYAE